MFLWNITVNIECQAALDRIWKRCIDVSSWHEWNQDIRWATLSGPFVQGATGWLTFGDYQPMCFTVRYVEKNHRFSLVIKKWCTTITCIFQLDRTDPQCVLVAERIVVGGLLAPFLRRTLAKKLQRSLPAAMRALRTKLL